MRISILTSGDARQPIAWSGTPYHMARALSRFGPISYLGPVFSFLEFTGRVRNRLSKILHGGGHTYDHRFALAREYARLFRRRVPPKTDLLVVPAGSTQIAFLDTEVPILYTSDATFRLLHNYHLRYANLPERYVSEADEIERRALHKASVVVYPSAWAARSACQHYSVPGDRIRILPYGANIESPPTRDIALASDRRSELHLLFIGRGWERKGGPIAFSTTALLREAGLPARLTVCGCIPPGNYRARWLDVIPFLDKRKPDDRMRLSKLLLSASFLFVPTRYDCYGIVFCEASAHGTPSIATDTGGVSGAVVDGENGHLLPESAGPEAYASRIAELFRSQDQYRSLVAGSRAVFEQRLNWDTWARSVHDIVAPLVGAPPK